MFYIGTKKGYVESITASGLLNETTDVRSAHPFSSWAEANHYAGKSAVLQKEYYAILGSQQRAAKLGKYVVELKYPEGDVWYAFIGGEQITEYKTKALKVAEALQEKYPKNVYTVKEI